MKEREKKKKNYKPRKRKLLPGRSHEINISVTEDERHSITSLAKETGLKISDFCYRAAKGQCIHKFMHEHLEMKRLVLNEINNLTQIENKSVTMFAPASAIRT